ncbi:MAG: hypothetical protein FWE18_01365 [Alphaproteobacteria bacterium]|nr:hypothetical protein [Alphaproteobacteria bacterium]
MYRNSRRRINHLIKRYKKKNKEDNNRGMIKICWIVLLTLAIAIFAISEKSRINANANAKNMERQVKALIK